MGNKNALNAVSSMIDAGRIPHGVVICGKSGLGKKTLALYIAGKLLCEQENAPCGKCRTCKMLLGGGHPDFIRVAPSLKSGAYKLEEDLRGVVSDAYIAPSEGKYKVYLIADMDKTPQGSQNALLKLIEEPPDHTVVILTASAKEYFLPTVLSRVITLGVSPVSKDECREYLTKSCGRSGDEIESAITAMGGNIGACLSFMDSKTLPKAVGVARDIALCVSAKSEYDILMQFWRLQGNKELALLCLSLLSEIFRDAVMLRMGMGKDSLIGCANDASAELAKKLSDTRLSQLCEIPEKYTASIIGNSNLTLCLNAVVADIMERIG